MRTGREIKNYKQEFLDWQFCCVTENALTHGASLIIVMCQKTRNALPPKRCIFDLGSSIATFRSIEISPKFSITGTGIKSRISSNFSNILALELLVVEC